MFFDGDLEGHVGLDEGVGVLFVLDHCRADISSLVIFTILFGVSNFHHERVNRCKQDAELCQITKANQLLASFLLLNMLIRICKSIAIEKLAIFKTEGV